jgi:fido (protein-threonine AMPylation protein)
MRTQGFGAERLTFGPHTSCHRDQVKKEISALFELARNKLRELTRQKDAPSFDESILSFAIWLHAKIVWIHPFEDGNGRSCRAIIEEVVTRFGLWLAPLEVPKQEYIEALNHFYTTAKLQPLIDLYLRLYEETQP